jgi:hypothetical protein
VLSLTGFSKQAGISKKFVAVFASQFYKHANTVEVTDAKAGLATSKDRLKNRMPQPQKSILISLPKIKALSASLPI